MYLGMSVFGRVCNPAKSPFLSASTPSCYVVTKNQTDQMEEAYGDGDGHFGIVFVAMGTTPEGTEGFG